MVKSLLDGQEVYIFDNVELRMGRVKTRHDVLLLCYRVDVYQKGIGPKTKEIPIPEYYIFEDADLLLGAIDEQIDNLIKMRGDIQRGDLPLRKTGKNKLTGENFKQTDEADVF